MAANLVNSYYQFSKCRYLLAFLSIVVFFVGMVFLVKLRLGISETQLLAVTLENEGAEVSCEWYELEDYPAFQRVWTFVAGGAPITRVSITGNMLRGQHSIEKILSSIEMCKNIPSLVLVELDLDAGAAKKISHVHGMSIWIDECRLSDQFIDVLDQGQFDFVALIGKGLAFPHGQLKNGRIVRQFVDPETNANIFHWKPGRVPR